MINETSSPRGAVMLGFIWISWQLEWKLEKVSERWNRLPVAERFSAATIVVSWTAPVKTACWNATK